MYWTFNRKKVYENHENKSWAPEIKSIDFYWPINTFFILYFCRRVPSCEGTKLLFHISYWFTHMIVLSDLLSILNPCLLSSIMNLYNGFFVLGDGKRISGNGDSNLLLDGSMIWKQIRVIKSLHIVQIQLYHYVFIGYPVLSDPNILL